MGLSTVFADSFAHYNTAGIPLKWTTAGGAIETNPVHVRTGLQSLRIQNGDVPSKSHLAGTGYSLVGFAWQTDTLAGEHICNLVDSASGDVQLYLVQNADGSISVWNGALATLLATSTAGVLTIGPFWYLEINTQINTGVGPTRCIVTVTSSPAGLATKVIDVSGFLTSQQSWDMLSWGGPVAPHHAWVDDFYNQSGWDGTGDPFAVMGAPKIYGANVPIADGLDYVAFNVVGKTSAFPGTAPPWWSQVNELPQSTAAPIFETDEIGGVLVGFIVCGQAFAFDVSSVPAGSKIACVQTTILYSASAGTNINQSSLGCMFYRTGDPVNHKVTDNGTQFLLNPGGTLPFQFYEFPFDLNPVTGLPFKLTDFTGPAALQVGPYIGEPA